MAVKSAVLIVVLNVWLLANSLDGPFRTGFSMGTLGAVTDKRCMLLCRDTLKNNTHALQCGLSATYTSFYDAMDNLRDKNVYEVGGAAFVKIKHMFIDLSIKQLNAFSVYFEQNCSAGLDYELLNLICLGVTVTGHRTGLISYNDTHVSAVFHSNIGARINNVVAGAEVYNIPLKISSTSGVMPMMMYGLGIQTLENRFGSQAFMLEIRPDLEKKVRWKLGDALSIGKRVNIQFAIANNPIQLSFGFHVEIKSLESSIALVNNEKLGWSKGVSFGWLSEW